MICDGGGAHSFVVRYGTGWHYFRAGALCSYMLLSLYTRVLSRLLFLVVYIYIAQCVHELERRCCDIGDFYRSGGTY